MYGSETQTKIPKHSHTATSFYLLGQPIAKISLLSPYQGFDSEVVQVSAIKVQPISPNIY